MAVYLADLCNGATVSQSGPPNFGISPRLFGGDCCCEQWDGMLWPVADDDDDG